MNYYKNRPLNRRCDNCHGSEIYQDILTHEEWSIQKQQWESFHKELRCMCPNPACETYWGDVDIYEVPVIIESSVA